MERFLRVEIVGFLMEREEYEKLKSQVLCDASTGKLTIPSQFGDLSQIPFEIKGIKGPVSYYSFVFDDQESAKSLYGDAYKLYADFQQDLGEIYRLYNPIIIRDIPTESTDLNNPKADTFSKNQKIIVRPSRLIKREYLVDCEGAIFSGSIKFEFPVQVPSYLEHLRKYDLEQDPKSKNDWHLKTQRLPVVFSFDRGNRVSIAGLSLGVLCSRLEPFTSSKIARTFRAGGTPADNEEGTYRWDVLSNKSEREEKILTQSVMRFWLEENAYKYDFNLEDIELWNPHNLDKDMGERVVKTVREIGLKSSVRYYMDMSWDLDRFLSLGGIKIQ